MFDKFHEECGVFGIFGHPDAANLTYLGLYALQHRGQESAGIVSSDGKRLYGEKAMGLVADIFTEDRIKRLPGYMAIGHNRYSTTGDSIAINIQPILVNFALGGLAIAHNGNLVNAGILKDELEAYGSIFQSTMDSEVIIHLIAQSRMPTLHERIVDALSHVQGSYSLLIITEEELIAVRDPNGFRPLSLAELDNGYVVASETCAFDLIEATHIRDIAPGEMIVIIATASVHRFPSSRRSRPTAFLSSSILPDRTAWFSARTYIPSGRISADSSPASPVSMPTSSSLSRIPACPRPWDILKSRGSPLIPA